MSRKCLNRLHVLCALALLFAGAALLAPPAAQAVLHYTNEGNNCYGCHTLDPADEEIGTNLIASVSRTLALMKLYNGGTVPVRFGCTYCHSNPANATMKEALSHFGAKTSKHPVGVNFVSGAETNNEYLSTVGSATANETDCVDCHDVALLAPGLPGSYIGHAPPGVGVRAAGQNPYMLRSVTTAGDYDNLCRVCHGAAAPVFKTQNVRVTSHADASAAQIREDDLTNLRTTAAGGGAQCTACHDTHFSGKVKLFNDGHEGDTAIVSADCTTVCHYNGDADDSFTTRGHGRPLSTYKYKSGEVDFTAGSNYIGINLSCTSCHATLDTSDTSAARKPHVETPAAGTIQDNYKAKFNLNLPVQGFDDGSSFGNPQVGVCFACHSSYDTHRGTSATAETGCQDCHDEHAEGSGAGANYFMIPETSKPQGTYAAAPPGGLRAKAGTEAVTYATPQRNPATGALMEPNESFYNVGNANGVCDNAECHGPKGYTPLSAYMAGTLHSGPTSGALAPGADCAGCHAHKGDPQGAWRASASCNDCHSFPGLPTTGAEHVLSGVHTRHVEAAPTGYGIGCTQCHFGYAHNTSGFVNGGVWNDTTVPPANVNVRIDTSVGSRDPGATNLTYNGGDADTGTTASATHNGTCVGLYCHGNNTTRQPDWTGANETPAWSTADPAPLGCGECHATTPATPAANGAHTDHMAVSTYVCGDCHGAVSESTHVDNQVTMAAALSYTGGLSVGDGSYGTCSTGSCHNATAGANVAWNVAASNCNQCHYRTAAGPEDNWVGNDKAASMVVAAEWTGYGHGKAGAAPLPLACTSCHAMANGHDFSAALDGAGNNPYRLSTGFTCSNTTGSCHAAGKSGPVTGVDISTVIDHSLAGMGADGKRNWPWTPQCANCHDPHGDGVNIAMIGNEIFDAAALNLLAAPGAGIGAENSAMTFTNAALGHDANGYTYADSTAPFSSICQECHTTAPATGMLSYLDGLNTSAGSHPGATAGNPGDCSACHKHAAAFKPSGCGGCHGNGGSSYWPEQAGNNRTLYPDRNGRHLTHMEVVGARLGYGAVPGNFTGPQQIAICAFCHNDTTGVGGGGHYVGSYGKTDAPANVGSFNQMWGAYADDADDVYNAAVYATDTFTSGSTCAAVDCHNNKLTGAGFEWYGASSGCINCHSDVTLAGDVSHNAHLTTTTRGLGGAIACASCHDPATLWTPPTSPAANHVNGTFTVTSYTGYSYPATNGTCGTNACHNSGKNSAPIQAYTWGTAIGAVNSCTECHNAATNSLVTQSHGAHLTTTTGAGAQCADCHAAATVNTHANGTVTLPGAVSFSYNGTAALGDAVYGTCGTNRCHNSGQSAAPVVNTYTWGSALNGTNSCTECHLATSALNTLAHPHHLAWPTYGCADCHAVATVATHGDGTVDLRAGLSYSGTPATLAVAAAGGTFGSCSTGSCHNATAPNIVWSSTQSNCSQCHAQTADLDDFNAQNKSASMLNSTEWAAVGHGKGGVAKGCLDCHSIAAAHDTSAGLTGTNPFRLGIGYAAPNTFCNNTGAGCHVTSGSVMTHDGGLMTGTYPQRTWNWQPKCYDCHEPHGDLTNLKMIRSDLWDNGAGTSGSSTHGVPYVTDADIVDFTVQGGLAAGSYADTVNANGVCQECHTGTVSFLDNDLTPIGGTHPGSGLSPCTSCHQHTEAFQPTGCEGCHNGSVALAPNVIDGTLPSNPALSYNWFGTNASKQDGGHGDPEGRDGGPAPSCTDCHDISLPAGFHGDGTLQSVYNNATRNANTAHLKAEYFTRSAPPSIPVGSGLWNVQVYFDNYCAEKCHPGKSVPVMWHEIDTLTTDGNHWSVELGTHMTQSNGDALGANYPIDADLNTAAIAADVDYAPCVSCHDPHGTTVVEPSKTSNRMVRDNWMSAPTLCNACHN